MRVEKKRAEGRRTERGREDISYYRLRSSLNELDDGFVYLLMMFSHIIPRHDDYHRDFDVCFNHHIETERGLYPTNTPLVSWDYSHYETERGLYSPVDYSHLLLLVLSHCIYVCPCAIPKGQCGCNL